MQSLWLRTAILNRSSSKKAEGEMHALVPGQREHKESKRVAPIVVPNWIEPIVAPEKASWVFFRSTEPGSRAQAITRNNTSRVPDTGLPRLRENGAGWQNRWHNWTGCKCPSRCQGSCHFGVSMQRHLTLRVLASSGRRPHGLQRYGWVIRWLGCVAIHQYRPCHNPLARLAFGDLQHRGPRCAFCCIGQCHCHLIIEFNVLAIFGVTAVCPRLSRPGRSLRDPLNQFLRLVLRTNVPQPCGDLTCASSQRRVPWSALRVEALSILQSQPISGCLRSYPTQALMRWHCLLLNSSQRHHHLFPLRCQLSQHCNRPWAVCQLTAEQLVRCWIRQFRHGCVYARSATMMGETFLVPWRWSQNLLIGHWEHYRKTVTSSFRALGRTLARILLHGATSNNLILRNWELATWRQNWHGQSVECTADYNGSHTGARVTFWQASQDSHRDPQEKGIQRSRKSTESSFSSCACGKPPRKGTGSSNSGSASRPGYASPVDQGHQPTPKEATHGT